MQHIEDLARQLAAAHAGRQPFESLSASGRRLTMDEAYAVQDRFVRLLETQEKASIAGYKIGLTSAVMQQMVGIDSPIGGAILSSRVHPGGWVLDRSAFGRVGLEFEVAVRLHRDLADGPADIAQVAAAVDAVCPAIEVVDDRGADYSVLDAASLVADNSWNAGIVLGSWSPVPHDLAARIGRVAVDGVQAEQGRVGDAFEHPFESVRWLSAQLARSGAVLRAGMIVMTGSIVKTRFPSEPGRWVYEIEGLGGVELEVR
jgi:2-keto-4-pentenoate hydratase